MDGGADPSRIAFPLLPSERRRGYSSPMNPNLKRAAWILNTLGFIFYLVWLSTLDARATLRSQDGILFYIPCVPFLFVYMMLINPKPKPKDKPWWQSDADYAREQAAKRPNAAPPPPGPAAKT